MAFPHGVDPTGTRILSSATWAALFTAINEKENYMGYTVETVWSNGAARPAANAFVGQRRSAVLGVGPGENLKLARDVLDTAILENDLTLPGNLGNFQQLWEPIEDITGWAAYANFADLYNTAMGAGVDWETATADLDDASQGDVTVIKEMLSVVAELKAFRIKSAVMIDDPGKNWQIWDPPLPPGHATTDLALAAAVAAGNPFAVGWGWLLGESHFRYDVGTDTYYRYVGQLSTSWLTVDGSSNPVATTTEAALEYQDGAPIDLGNTQIQDTVYMRESNAAEYAAPDWAPDVAGTLLTIFINGPTGGNIFSNAGDISTILNVDGTKTYLRFDNTTTNPFVADPNEAQETWMVKTTSLFYIRVASTNWTYE